MGYSYQLVAMPKEQLLRLWGSRDEALLARVLGSDRRYVSYLLEGERRKGAVAELFLGGTDAEPVDLQYALEAVCFALGTSLGSLDTRDVDRIEKLTRTTLFPNVGERWPLPIPDSTEWPFVGIATSGELKALKERLAQVEPPAPEMERFALEAAVDLFTEAAATGTDAIIFLH
ncbi:MAG: hypothetical protein QM723_08825 [Myxococcaceae bacterium]